MKLFSFQFWLSLLIAGFVCTFSYGDSNFKQPPTIKKKGGDYLISFEVRTQCDATVAIVNKQGIIVRHLASGVLGKNAPAPFQKNSLRQSIIWDGKTDTGKPAPKRCKVQVALGLTPSYGGTLAFNPYHVKPYSVACDQQGNAYVFTADSLGGDIQIRMFSREGKFLRYVQPIPGGLKKFAYQAQFTIVDTPKGPIYVPKKQKSSNHRILRGLGVAVSSGDVLAYVNNGYRVKMHLRTLKTDGSDIKVGSQIGPWQRTTGRALLTFAKDEKHLYVSSLLPGESLRSRTKPYHCVLRIGLKDPTPKVWRGERGYKRGDEPWGGKIPLFVGDPYKAGNDNSHLNDPRGVAVDKAGNVYIADYGNNRIQVFTPEAKPLRTLPVETPDRIAVHRKTGDIYALIPSKPSKIVKLSPKGKILATFEFPGYRDGNQGYITSFALDDSAEPAILWIGLPEGRWNQWQGLWRVADRGKLFEKLGEVAKYDVWPAWGAQTSQYLAVDPKDNWLHMKNSRMGGRARNWGRFNAKTGKLDPNWHERVGVPPADEISFGPDGLLYGRTCQPAPRGKPEYVWRFDPEKEQEVPFPAGKNGRITYTGWHSPKFHRDGFDVAPNGDVYILQHINAKAAGFKPEPWRSSMGFTPLLLNHFGPDGKLKRKDILPGILPGPGGLRVDNEGCIYMPLNLQRWKAPTFDLIPEFSRSNLNELNVDPATHSKFSPKGGRILINQKEGEWTGYGVRKPKIQVEGLLKTYAGLSPFGSGCVCKSCRIDLDGFSRTYAPIYHLSCVMVLDSNLNPILRVGTYGGPVQVNGKVRHIPELGMARPAYVTANDHAFYIADPRNRCILRVKLNYQISWNSREL